MKIFDMVDGGSMAPAGPDPAMQVVGVILFLIGATILLAGIIFCMRMMRSR